MTSTRSTQLRYVPSLDGLRALAVAAVFLFHANVSWASGGFLGVSLFFTLSGFLITTLLLNEGAAQRTIDVVGFWARRVRRLLPAALVTVVFVLVLSASVLRVDPATLRGDALAAIGYVANWHLLFTGQSYAALFRDPSPLVHYWSLAIEEQFYLLFPLAVLLVRRRSSSGPAFRSKLRVMLLCGLALSIVTSVVAGALGATDFVYYSLPTRGGEILVGALLATTWSASRLVGQRGRAWPLVTGGAALVAMGALVASTTSLSSWVTHGGLTAFALLSALLILSALPGGPFAALLGLAPLRWLGRISYGIYLYHWPLILWLTSDRVGLRGWALIAIQAAATLAVSTASYYLLELPIRRGRVIAGRPARLAAPAALALASVLVVWTTASFTQPPLIDFARSAAALGTRHDQPRGPGTSQPPLIEMIGDSTGLATADGLHDWGRATGEMDVQGWSINANQWLGCGLVQTGLVRYEGIVSPAAQDCSARDADWAAVLDGRQPVAVVVQFGPFDAADHLLPGDSTWRGPGDPIYDRQLYAAMTALADVSLARGIPTVWLTSPITDVAHENVPPGTPQPEGDPARMQRINGLIRELADQHPGIHLVDLAGWLSHRPDGVADPNLRPDGVHFSSEAAQTIVAPWLGPAILHAAGLDVTPHVGQPPG